MSKKLPQIAYLIIAAIMLLSVALTGCGGTESNDDANSGQGNEQTLITIGTATVGGAWYPMGGGLANLISNYVPNAKANATPTGASIENLTTMKNKKMEIGFATMDVPYQMYRGIGFDKDESIRTLVMNDFIYLALIVDEDSNIKTFNDIKGKKLGTGVPGSATYMIVEEVLKAHGMTYDDVNAYPGGTTQQAEALKDGTIDMFANVVAGSGGAAPGIVELATTADIRFIALDEEVLNKIHDEKPYYLVKDIPAGWVDTLEQPVKSFAVGTVICIREDLSEDIVYNITKNIFEHKDELDAIHPQWERTTLETVALDLPAPLHPGAEKYFNEVKAPISYLP